MWVVHAIVQLFTRVVVGTAVALLFALVLALVREDSSFVHSLGIACLVVGCLSLLMAPAGSSPSMRMGVNDPWLTSFAPKLIPQLGAPYEGPTLNPAAAFFLTGVALIVFGFVLL